MAPRIRVAPVSEDSNVYELVFASDDEHRFNPESIAAIHQALDEVEKNPSAAALITTNEGRFFSNGLDIQFLMENSDKHQLLIDLFQNLLKRVLCFPIPTVAAVCGHAVAGGCMLVLAHDYRVMRSDKGFIFLNEVEINMPLTAGMNALIKSKLPVHTFHKAVLAGHRYNGKAAAEAGFVNAAFPDSASTKEAAIKIASELAEKNFDRQVYRMLKEEMFKLEINELLHGGPAKIPDVHSRL